MNNNEIIISGNHLELTSRMKDMVESKTSKLFNHEERIQRLRVELGRDDTVHSKKGEFWVKGHIEMKGEPLIVQEQDELLYKALDQMVQKLDRMLRRRSRLRVVKRKQANPIDIPAEIPKVPNPI